MKKRYIFIAVTLLLAVLVGVVIVLKAGSIATTGVKSALPQGNQRFSLKVGGLEREYVVHVSVGYNGNTALPAVIMFHGGGGTALQTMQETGWDAKADQENFLAILPEGTRADPSHPASFVGNPQTWNDGSERGTLGAVDRNTDDIGFVAAMISDIQKRFVVDKQRIYVTGFSNGASMAFRGARELSPLIAAVAPVAGNDWTTTAPTRPVPLLYMTGTADPLNPLAGGEIHIGNGKSLGTKQPVTTELAVWAKLHGCTGEPRVIYNENGAHGMSYCHDNAVELYTIDGHGHFWPGGKTDLPRSIAGENTARINATDVIWNFFQQYQLPH